MQVFDLRSTSTPTPEQWLQSATPVAPGEVVALRFTVVQYWLESAPAIDLVLIHEPALYPGGEFAVAQWQDDIAEWTVSAGGIHALAMRLHVPCLSLLLPLPLQPVHIPKPWGEEIWFTGIEQRGVAGCGDADCQVPLPWVLSAFPDRTSGGDTESLILLKILAPLPEEVRGDLYLELHEEKREVYVVTHVDQQAWPTGVGGIRFGFDSDKLQALGADDFRGAFLAAVQRYEVVRREIDELLDERGADVAIPAPLVAQEAELRADMNSFTGMMPLRVGDVVKVPTFTPHSLQHGVRTVEFQTPVYERMILAFAQKVLTQNHWDTERAVAAMELETPPQPEPELLRREYGGREERIVDFEDFEVRRFSLDGPAGMALPTFFDYGLIMCVKGEIEVAGRRFRPEQAGLLTSEVAGHQLLGCDGAQPAVCLLALPR